MFILSHTVCYFHHQQQPAAKLIATVTFVHGLGEHCSRYDHLFGPFAEAGIKVIAYDQRGFGKTCRKSGIIGHSEGIKTVLADIKWAEDRVRTDKIPHFVMGHSMVTSIIARGGCVAAGKIKIDFYREATLLYDTL